MVDSKAPLTADLVWSDHLCFGATSGPNAIVVDGDGAAGPSPMQLAAFALAGCMAADVVAILQKGGHTFTGLRVAVSADRAPAPPRRFVRVALHFHVTGPAPQQAVERAIALSQDRYCSVWHSMRQDVSFQTSFDIVP